MITMKSKCVRFYALRGYCTFSMEDVIHMKVIRSRPVTGDVIIRPK